MSLNWNLTDIQNHEEVWSEDHPKESSITEAIIWDTMAVDMGKITEDNYRAFYARLVMFNQAAGITDDRVTLADVKRRVGLRTNVTTTSDAAYKGRLYRILKERADREVSKQAGWIAHEKRKAARS